MTDPLRKRAISAALSLVWMGACAAPAAPPTVNAPASVSMQLPQSRPTVEPRATLSAPLALLRGRMLVKIFEDAPASDPKGFMQEEEIAEPELRAIVAKLAEAASCVEDEGRERCSLPEAPRTADGAEDPLPMLLSMIAELSDTAPGVNDSVALLLRLDALGVYHADVALKRIVERRFAATTIACAPSEPNALLRQQADLRDFAVFDEVPLGAATAFRPRTPTSSEVADLAYLLDAVAESGEPVGGFAEDFASPPLGPDAPQLLERRQLDAQFLAAGKHGDAAAQLQIGIRYLETLGYPGPLRSREEGDMRWGGAGSSFLLRKLARRAELLGRYELAEGLYRRAQFGGGACGTSTSSYQADQLQGVIRSAEQARGCRAAVAERLFAVSFDSKKLYGPQVLTARGLDISRVYRGALLTRHRRPSIFQAISGQGPLAEQAIARMKERGVEAWMERTRALEGYADTAGASGLDTLLGGLQGGSELRSETLGVLQQVLRDNGTVCPKTKGLFGRHWSRGPRGSRSVTSLMDDCATRPTPPQLERVRRELARLSSDKDPEVRRGVAQVLGALALPVTLPLLKKMTADPFAPGGETCTSRGTGPMLCRPSFPVADAAREAIERLADIAERQKARHE